MGYCCCCCSLWMRLWADFSQTPWEQPHNPSRKPVRASCCLRPQQSRPPRVNPIKAVICPATPAARCGGAVKPRLQEAKTTVVTFWKSLRQTSANTNFDKNSTQEYLPQYKKNTNACEINLIKYPDSWKAVCLRALQQNQIPFIILRHVKCYHEIFKGN